MSNQGSVYFTKEQIEFLMTKTGADDAQEAVEIFAVIIKAENIDPVKMPVYLRRLMEKEGVAR